MSTHTDPLTSKPILETLADISPLPATTAPVTEPEYKETASTLVDTPTASHAIALDAVNALPEEEKGPDTTSTAANAADTPSLTKSTGAAQLAHDGEVVNLGWNAPKDQIANPLVGRLPNEELWLLVRRFDKQMYHLKEVPYPVPGNLDLNIADEEEFSPDKLRSNIERLYMTVIVGTIAFGKQIARLRSWRETRRTAWFCSFYFTAWAFDFLVPLLSITLIMLITYPPSRGILFPPAPIALVSSSGGVQKPKAGVLGSHDSLTGAPENYKGEAVEQEASNFVNGIASVAISSAAGKHPQSDPEHEDGNATQDSVPDPTAIAVGAATAKDTAAGAKTGAKHDKTKVPMETALWTKMRPAMHGMADVADTWERFANALSPTPPFPRDVFRLRLAGVIVPLLAVSIMTTSYMFMKGVTFGIGFGLFGDPITSRGLVWLNKTFPNWQKMLELRNTLLKGVPTNAQLTITLLRIGEANKAPLPPPPRTDEPPPEVPAEVSDENLRAAGGDWPLSATTEELDEAMAHDPTVAHETGGADIDKSKDAKHGKKGGKLLAFFKGTTKGTVETAIGVDKLKAKAGSDKAKDRLGAIPKPGVPQISGPVDFKSRYHGRKGHVYIATKATIPCVAFSTDSTIEKIGSQEREDLHPVWSIAIGDIRELKKIGGYGWKAKLVIGWALDRQVNDGLEIVDKKGNSWVVTACPLRDELFNRLCAMGGQKWESW